MPVVNFTWLSWVTFAVVGYYGLLLAVPPVRRLGRSLRGRAPAAVAGLRQPFIVLVIPARNEAAVLGETLSTLAALDYQDWLVLVMDDGSTDGTAGIAASFSPSGKVLVVRRPPEIAGQGKGAVLNHAFAVVCQMADDGDPRLGGRGADDVLVAIMDADGQLERDALGKVAPYFTGPAQARVGGVQIGVRIANATSNLLARMQDFEFVGFSALVQGSRNSFGSVGLGGNGQFTRLSALRALGRDPWTACLTEDLDLSLSLAAAGWDIRYCPDTYVAQQGLTRLWPLLRQRTRWIQGHYQCWRHMAPIWRSRRLSLLAKLDLTVYLLMILVILVVFAGLVTAVLGYAGVLYTVNTSLSALTNPVLHNLVQLVMTAGPLAAFIAIYQARAYTPLRWWELPAVSLLFAGYAYIFVVSQAWAAARIITRRGAWSKTPRVRAEIAVQMTS